MLHFKQTARFCKQTQSFIMNIIHFRANTSIFQRNCQIWQESQGDDMSPIECKSLISEAKSLKYNFFVLFHQLRKLLLPKEKKITIHNSSIFWWLDLPLIWPFIIHRKSQRSIGLQTIWCITHSCLKHNGVGWFTHWTVILMGVFRSQLVSRSSGNALLSVHH